MMTAQEHPGRVVIMPAVHPAGRERRMENRTLITVIEKQHIAASSGNTVFVT
jgi:hypothetical protein